jgi:hypothetical protein
MFDDWIEEVENTVYVHFQEDLDFFVDMYGLDLDYYFENGSTPMMIVNEIQEFLEEDGEQWDG